MRRSVLIAVSLALLTGCGGSDSSTTGVNTDAPAITNLRVARNNPPPVVGRFTLFPLAVDFVDRNGDLIAGGSCHVGVTVSGVTLARGIAAPGFPSTAPSGTALCTVLVTYGARPATVTVSVVDAAGHESNTLSVNTLL